ncbi:hypothetical protein [Desulfosporosinus sp. SB140]|uniref:hypothetical protein n=1 Tax=Desulfosporosinus paludis TaxID=3115649 RepID=UPI00388DE649
MYFLYAILTERFKNYVNKESERRFWEIENFGRVSCGGTHLRTTGEVGEIKLKRDNIGRNRELIEIVLV